MKDPQRGTPDFALLFVTIVLVIFGFAMVFSASSVLFPRPWFLSQRNAVYIIVGMIVMFTLMNIQFARIKKLVKPFFLFVTFLLLMLPFFGTYYNGAKSWFVLGPFNLQPAELAKLAVVLYLAALISKKGNKFKEFKKGLFPVLCILLFVAALIMIQPDFGSACILVGGGLVVIVSGGANLRHLFIGGVGLAAIGSIFLTGHRKDRITAYLNPWADPQGTGYQLIQALYAFGHGGLTGAGFGKGIQKLHYLPFPYNDFIFAIIGEEFGFIGSVGLLIAYLILFWRGIIVSLRCRDTFGMMTGVGIVGMFAIQVFINIGGVTGAIPMTGVTLPFISYGGTSMVVSFMCVGILLSISREQSRLDQLENRQSPKEQERNYPA